MLLSFAVTSLVSVQTNGTYLQMIGFTQFAEYVHNVHCICIHLHHGTSDAHKFSTKSNALKQKALQLISLIKFGITYISNCV